MADPNIRDARSDERNAYVQEYESYRRGGLDEAADNIARILRDQYGHDVTATTTPAKAQQLETTAASEQLENTAMPRGDQATRADDATATDDDDLELNHVGGGTYELSNGERVKGREAAVARQRELNQGEQQ